MAHFHGPGGFADAEVANDVHLMILDHLAYQATQALLADLSAADATNGHRARDHFLESHLELFSCRQPRSFVLHSKHALTYSRSIFQAQLARAAI